MWAIPTFAEKADYRGALRQHFGRGRLDPRYNIAPTQPIPVIRQNPKEPVRELSLVRWGLIPSWAKDSSAAAKMSNARSETAGTKPAFREALKSRRCLILADLAAQRGFRSARVFHKCWQPFVPP